MKLMNIPPPLSLPFSNKSNTPPPSSFLQKLKRALKTKGKSIKDAFSPLSFKSHDEDDTNDDDDEKTIIGEDLVNLNEKEIIQRPQMKRKLTLLDLPYEILCIIAMDAGFFAAITLRKTCSKLFHILNTRLGWYYYNKRLPGGGMVDKIENTIEIMTRLHHYDHLVFGLWNTSEKNDQYYFEHLTFYEKFDYLGGVVVQVKPGGLIESEFFDHRETLPCYIDDVLRSRKNGSIPAMLTNSDIYQQSNLALPDTPMGNDVTIDHSCEDCAVHDFKQPLSTSFLYNHLQEEGGSLSFTRVLTLADGKRSIVFKIVNLEADAPGYSYLEELPMCTINRVKINGKMLNKFEFALFKRLCN